MCYSKLKPGQFRILTLWPSRFEDEISISLTVETLASNYDPPCPRMSLGEVEATLPPGWNVQETMEGRYIFQNDETEDTFWSHPNPSFELQLKPDQVPETGNYEALSYVWGSPQPSESIKVVTAPATSDAQGSLIELGFISVGINLMLALRNLRLKDAPRELWIDALCINQQDYEERGEQVRHMASIYRSAKRVVVWLGSENGSARRAFSTLSTLGAQVEVSKRNSRARAPNAFHKDWFRSRCELPYDAATWNSIQELAGLPWFERLWVWQEIQMANAESIFQCGQDTMLWYHFRRAIMCLYGKHLPTTELLQRIALLSTSAYYQRDRPFSYLMNSTQIRKCSDARDRIYGILGLAPPAFVKSIQPRYDIPVGTVYTQAFLAQLGLTGRFGMLHNCDLAVRQIDAPSWVPDWSLEQQNSQTSWDFASGLSRAHYKYYRTSTHDVLKVAGLCYAIVRTTGTEITRDRHQAINTMRAWTPKDVETAEYVHGGKLIDAYTSIICGNGYSERHPTVRLPTFKEWKKFLLTHFTQDANSTPEDISKDPLFGRMFRFVIRRVLMTSEEGHVCLGPATAKAGDMICIILGSDQPMLLRPVPSGHYVIVGDCCTYSLSDATALLGPLPEGWCTRFYRDDSDLPIIRFHNSSTGEETIEDPRLGPLPVEWERKGIERTSHHPEMYQTFRNRATGEVMNSDPRMFPEALKARGVPLREFELV